MAAKKIEQAGPLKEVRTAALSLKIRPSLKTALVHAAAADGRTVAQFTERLLEVAMREQGHFK